VKGTGLLREKKNQLQIHTGKWKIGIQNKNSYEDVKQKIKNKQTKNQTNKQNLTWRGKKANISQFLAEWSEEDIKDKRPMGLIGHLSIMQQLSNDLIWFMF
jgi:hypothetical protein